jgi:hypothetical protein
MRHSFLPTIEQKKLKREYHIHVIIVALFFLSAVGLIGSGSLFPAYLTMNTEARQQQIAMDALKSDNDKSGIAELERELALHNVRMAALSVQNDIPSSALIQNAVAARGTVRLSSIAVEHTSSTTVTIRISGQAPTRDSLVGFKTRLEKLEDGTKVELPISDFAKSRDIPFSLRVIQPII